MPAAGIIGAGAEILGGAKSSQSAKDNNEAGQQLTNMKNDLQAKEYNQDWANKIASSNNWQDYVNKNFSVSPYSDYITQATNAVSPQYDQQIQDTITDTGDSLMARGMYGQLPGDIQTQNAVSQVQANKSSDISNLANNLYQTAKNQNLTANQYGASQFGTYGNVTTPSINYSSPDTSKKVTWTQRILDPGGFFG